MTTHQITLDPTALVERIAALAAEPPTRDSAEQLAVIAQFVLAELIQREKELIVLRASLTGQARTNAALIVELDGLRKEF